MQPYLDTLNEPLPAWLNAFDVGSKFSAADFFGSRTVFYPGSGFDGQPVALFSRSRAAHCFIYADYLIELKTIKQELQDPVRKFRGYEIRAAQDLAITDLIGGWKSTLSREQIQAAGGLINPTIRPFGYFVILERTDEVGEVHGPRRLAILFLGSDAVAAYDALYCQHQTPRSPPFALVIEDYGFGGQYTPFGQGGLLEALATSASRLPRFLLCATRTPPWTGYTQVPHTVTVAGGMHRYQRALYQQA